MVSDESWIISPNAESSSSCRWMEIHNQQIKLFRRNQREIHSRLLCLKVETYICNQLGICFFCEVCVGAATIENYSFLVATPSIKTQWAASIINSHNLCLVKISEIIKLKQLKIHYSGADVKSTKYKELNVRCKILWQRTLSCLIGILSWEGHSSLVCLFFHLFMEHLAKEKYENF